MQLPSFPWSSCLKLLSSLLSSCWMVYTVECPAVVPGGHTTDKRRVHVMDGRRASEALEVESSPL